MTIFILTVLGLCAGSFINALVWRIRSQAVIYEKIDKLEQAGKIKHKTSIDKLKTQLTELSIWRGRSMCTDCKHQLGLLDLIPVFSWLLLGGKCRYCKKPIAGQYPLVEIAVALLFVLLFRFFPLQVSGFSPQTVIFVGWLLFSTILMSLFIYDLKWMQFPDILLRVSIIGAFILAVLGVLLGSYPWWSPLVGSLVVGGFLLALNRVSAGKWMGDGDAPLGVAVGLALGWQLGLLALLGSFYVGFVLILPVLFSKKKRSTSKVPYGPFLIIATFIALLWGQQIIDWYLRVVINI